MSELPGGGDEFVQTAQFAGLALLHLSNLLLCSPFPKTRRRSRHDRLPRRCRRGWMNWSKTVPSPLRKTSRSGPVPCSAMRPRKSRPRLPQRKFDHLIRAQVRRRQLSPLLPEPIDLPVPLHRFGAIAPQRFLLPELGEIGAALVGPGTRIQALRRFHSGSFFAPLRLKNCPSGRDSRVRVVDASFREH